MRRTGTKKRKGVRRKWQRNPATQVERDQRESTKRRLDLDEVSLHDGDDEFTHRFDDEFTNWMR